MVRVIFRRTWKAVIVLMILSVFILSNCAQSNYATSSLSLTYNVTTFESFYNIVEDLLRKKQDEEKIFTEEEWKQFSDLDNTISILLYRFHVLANLDFKNVSLYDVEFMYEMSKDGYITCKGLIESKYESFSPIEKAQLTILDNQVKAIDKEVTNLFKNPSNENITKSIILITGILSTTVKILALLG